MRRQADPLQKVTLNLLAGDMERLQRLHPRMGGSYVIRLLVRKHLKEAGEDLPDINLSELDLGPSTGAAT